MNKLPKNLRSLGLTLVLAMVCASGHAAQRVALVIGNAAYDTEKPLSNPGNDAKDMAALLSRLGFNAGKVQPLLNLKRKAMNGAVQDFLSQAEGADLAVVYYSGHGMQTGGETFLIPTDAQIQTERDVRSDGIRLGELMDDLEAHHIKRTLIVLDACRDNPFRTRTKGIAKGLAPPKEMNSGGFLVAYATADGQTADDGAGRNGTYTAELLRHLGQSAKSLRDQVEDTQLAVEQSSNNTQRPKVYGDTAKFRDVFLTASLSPELATGRTSAAAPPSPAAPSANTGVSLEDLAKEESNRRQWAQWQQRMQADFDKTENFQASADNKVKAWERFIAAWAEVNPYTSQDKTLRATAQQRLNAAQAQVQAALPATGNAGATSDGSATLAAGQIVQDCAVCPKMVVIPSGSFTMGSNDGASDEKPPHQVSVKSYLLGQTLVTQGQWRAIMGSNLSHFANCGDTCPVESINWKDAQAFATALSQKTGKNYRLPSEAEWEYAARAGTNTKWSFGDNESELGQYAWYSANSNKHTHPVAQKKPNAWGLYDMHGNAWEWMQDVHHDSYSGAPTDGSAWTSGDLARRVLRGGAWIIDPGGLRSANRIWSSPDIRYYFSGLRIARTL